AQIARKLAQVIGNDSDVLRVNFDWMEPARQLRIRVDQDQVRQLNVSSATLASVLNSAISGSVVTQLRDDIYLVNVVARSTETERTAVSTLRSLQVPIPGGRTVPLTQFASFDYEQEYPLIWRRNREPTLTVRADVRPGILPDTVVGTLEPPIRELEASLPSGY